MKTITTLAAASEITRCMRLIIQKAFVLNKCSISLRNRSHRSRLSRCRRPAEIFFSVFAAIILIIGYSNSTYSRLFFIGSNPYTSYIAFPQDILLIHNSFIGYRLGYQWGPSYGNTENHFEKPNTSYAASDEQINFAKEPEDTKQSSFKKSGYTTAQQHTVLYHRIWGKDLQTMFSLSYKNLSMNSSFDGNLRTQKENAGYSYIPVKTESSASSHLVYAEAAIAYNALKIPVGLKIGIGHEWKDKPESSFEANVDGSKIKSDRITWGWSTSGCNHIFGTKKINGDAWLLNSYTKGSTDQFDIQAGSTFEAFRIGTRYRYRKGEYQQYTWKSDNVYEEKELTQTQKLDANFNGAYKRTSHSNATDQHIARMYGNVTFLKNDFFKFNTLFFLGGDFLDSKKLYSEDKKVTDDSLHSTKAVVIEVNPNVNIYPDKRTTIDAALLSEFYTARHENSVMQGTSGGRKKTWSNSSVYIGNPQSWENFSFADEHFFDLGAELNAYLPLYGNKDQSLGCSIILLFNNKFTFVTKHYGENKTNGNTFTFHRTNTRKDYTQETWFNTAFGLTYRHEKIIIQANYVQPLVYKRYFETEVNDSKGKRLYKHASMFEPGIQQGANASANPAEFGTETISVMVAYIL